MNLGSLRNSTSNFSHSRRETPQSHRSWHKLAVMAESCVIEVYENETHGRSGGWVSYAECPFIMKATMTPCKPIEEINVPSSEWAWSTNWKITKMPGVTDAEGWEYASRFSRFKIKDRAPKSEARWSRARRRLWTRIMRREPVVKTTDMTKVLSKVQGGLTSIHSARIKIEQIMRSAPEAATSDQMKSLVASVERNIADILSVLDQAEQQAQQSSSTSANGSAKASTSPAVLKKLRNDVLKEQVRMEKQQFYFISFTRSMKLLLRWPLSGRWMVDLP